MGSKLKNWRLVNSKPGPDLTLFKVRWDSVENPRTSQVLERLVLETEDWVNIVPITTDDQVVLVEQYRFGVGKMTCEIPGGVIDQGEDSKSAAMRELEEETGYTGGKWIYLGSVDPNPAFHTNRCHHWLALDIEKTKEPSLDPGEDIRVSAKSFSEIRNAIIKGEIGHVLALSALSRVPGIWNSIKEIDFYDEE